MPTASNLLNRIVAVQLNDPAGDSWSIPELLKYLNEALQQLPLYVPQQFAKTEVVVLTGAVEQTLPSDGVKFIRVHNNVGSNDTEGRAPRGITRTALDRATPAWRSETAGPTRHYGHEPSLPKQWWVHPAAVAGEKQRIEYAAAPAELKGSSVIPVDDAFLPALIEFVAYRAYSKDAEYSGQEGRARVHYTNFLGMVGGNGESQ